MLKRKFLKAIDYLKLQPQSKNHLAMVDVEFDLRIIRN